MFLETVHEKISFDKDRRIVVISDIHGNLPLFKGLLEKIHFSKEDILILLGDMLEKGKYNLKLLRYIMELEKNYQVHSLCGNCDSYVRQFFETDTLDQKFFNKFLRHPKNRHSIIRQMGKEAGIKDLRDLAHVRKTIQKTHKDVYDWLNALPTIIECEEYFFVHGGVEDMSSTQGQDAWYCMKNDYFYEKNLSFPKYIVVGHCPTTLYRENFQDASPIIDHERKIISIDGGCVLKLDGQLNGLILEKGEISWTYYDGLPQVRVLEHQKPTENPLNVRWGHSEVKILEELGEFSQCLHVETGKNIAILKDFLREEKGRILCEDATDYCLGVEAGEIISLSHPVEGGFLGKKDGVTGWYWGKYEEIPPDEQEKGTIIC